MSNLCVFNVFCLNFYLELYRICQAGDEIDELEIGKLPEEAVRVDQLSGKAKRRNVVP